MAAGQPGEPDALTARLADERVDHRFKGLPPDADGLTVGELAAQRRTVFAGGFTTPLLTLSAEALEHNLALLGAYSERHGLAFAPHGKTTMAPGLFARQLAHGAWGVTVAVPHQARVCRAFGVRRVFLANELVDAAALRWVAGQLADDPGFRFVCYVDSPRGVELMEEALAGSARPVDVVVELAAGEGARTGVRTDAAALEVAGAAARAKSLRLVGVAGYEAQVPDASPSTVRAWLRRLVALTAELDAAGLFADAGEIVLSAGGSEWFDAVADVFARVPELSAPVLKLLRSGAYVSHDHGHYERLTPFNRVPEEGALEPAFRLWAQVVSRPTREEAFLNAGKRDVSYDLGLPVPHLVRSGRDGAVRPAEGMAVTALSDQHAWLRTDPRGTGLEVGDWVALGLAHPCTVFEKWPLIPLVEADGTAVDYVRTFF
ncbi:alanine racemase [Streptomyces somaliensis DSM 40738]|uniref:Amino acid deaminase n=1 Tax=Streptomyces somaliensis (strain ATCC 33201 / DSM 40738 / JCM 12659 / KCTC 9044 / NCTC 11332 / NRRL B-12077 / IP 733) TaxID=1134445 RepID=A0AA44DAJ6_STRE0|nr:alanine racemase [Streptomyces somaliensis]MCQ0023932.1 alanine racemase [Streptomyces somaliensis DSM 40738]NKY13084.1 amino acid deaminase [Streptomyces somaliensis DSM 40738]